LVYIKTTSRFSFTRNTVPAILEIRQYIYIYIYTYIKQPSHNLKIHLNITLPSTRRSSKLSFSFRSPYQNPTRTTFKFELSSPTSLTFLQFLVPQSIVPNYTSWYEKCLEKILVSILTVSCLTSYNNQQYKRKLQRVYNNVTL